MLKRILCLLLLLAWPAFASAGVTEDIAALSPGEWYSIPSSSLTGAGIYPSPLPLGGVPSDVLNAWCGAAYDTTRKRFLAHGGGHSNYAGNEIYAFDLDPASLTKWTWTRIWGPTPNAQIPPPTEMTHIYLDGNPSATHTYGGMVYQPSVDQLFRAGGGSWGPGGYTTWLWTFDFASSTWTHRTGAVNGGVAVSVWDSRRNRVVVRDQAHRIFAYDPATGVSVDLWNDPSMVYFTPYGTGAYDPVSDEIVYVELSGSAYGRPYGGTSVFNLSTNTLTELVATTPAIAHAGGIGLDYDAANNRLVAYHPTVSQLSVWLWDRVARTWTEQAGVLHPGSTAPSANTYNGSGVLHNKWWYVPHLGGFVVVVNASDTVHFFKTGTAIIPATTVTTFTIREKAGVTTTNYPLTFGHGFKQGDVPDGHTINVQLGDGTRLSTQYECKRTWADGSCKHAVISAILPTVTASSDLTVSLVQSAELTNAAGTGMTKSQILATDVESRIDLTNMSGGGTTNGYSGSKYASLREAVTADSYSNWLAGSVVTEVLARQDILDAAGRDQLNGYWEARIYPGTNQGDGRPYMRVSSSIENVEHDHRAGVTYDVEIKLGNASPVTKYTRVGVAMASDSRWRKVYWVGAEPPEVELRFDKHYWVASKLVPSFDLSLTPPEQVLAGDCFTSGWSETQEAVGYACWQFRPKDIGDNGFLLKYMPDYGSRPEIALLPKWEVLYWLTMDNRMREITLAHSEISGGIPIHVRDASTGRPISINDYPNSQFNVYSVWPTAIGTVNRNGWWPELPHHPSLAYTSYLITGERWHLDELYYWADFVGITDEPGNKNNPLGVYRGQDLGLIYGGGQSRGQAWGARSIGMALGLAPDNETTQAAYFQQIMNNNIAWWNGTLAGVAAQHVQNNTPLHSWGMAAWPQAYGEYGGNYTYDFNRTWDVKMFTSWFTDDFNALALRFLYDLGFTGVQPILQRFGQFIIERFSNQDGWNRYEANNYQAPHAIYDRKLNGMSRYSSRTLTFSATNKTITDPNANFVALGLQVGDNIELLFAANAVNRTNADGGATPSITLTGVTPTQLTVSNNIVDELPKSLYVPAGNVIWRNGDYQPEVQVVGGNFMTAGFYGPANDYSYSYMNIRVTGSSANDGEWFAGTSPYYPDKLLLYNHGRTFVPGTDPGGTVTFEPTFAIELDRSRDHHIVQSWAEIAQYLSSTVASFPTPDYPEHYQFQALAAVASVAEFVPGGIDVYKWLNNSDGDGVNNGVDTVGQALYYRHPKWAIVPRALVSPPPPQTQTARFKGGRMTGAALR